MSRQQPNRKKVYNTKKIAKIRLSSKYVFLTYPHCDLDLEYILDYQSNAFSTEGVKIVKHIIAHELHEDGTPHRHCWYELNRAPDYQKHDFYDLARSGQSWNGNYQAQRCPSKCAKYCIKAGEYITSFTPNQLETFVNLEAKEKLDMRWVASELMNGRPISELLTIFPQLFFKLKEIEDNMFIYKRICANADSKLEKLDNLWIYGDTGVGKSKRVWEQFEPFHKKSKEDYWCTYKYEDTVYYEDVDWTWGQALVGLKEVADYYPVEVKVKHKGSMKIRPKRIIVTSNYTIEEVFTTYMKSLNMRVDPVMIKAIERRFTVEKMESFVNPDPLDVFPDSYFCQPSSPFKFDFMAPYMNE